MTQFSNAPILSGKRPDGAFLSGTQLENAITTDSLQVFNVPSVGAINQGNGLSELRQAFGLLGNVVQGAGQITAEARAKQEVFDRGEAASRSSLDNIDVARSFDENPDSIPDGVKASEYATSLVEAQINTQYANKSEAWKNTYRENSAPKLANLVRSHLDQRQNVKTAEALTGFSELAYNGKVDEALAGARALPGITEQQVYAGVILPGLKTAASVGTPEAAATFERLAKALPEGQFATDVDPLRVRLEAANLARKADEYEQANNVILGMLDDGTPIETIKATVNALNDSKQLAPGKADHWRNVIDNKIEANRRDAAMAKGAAIVAAAKSGGSYLDNLTALATSDPDVYDRILPHVQRAERAYVTGQYVESVQSRVQAGVPLASVMDADIPLPSGGTVKVSGKDAQEAVMNAELSRIYSTGDPATQLPRAIEWSAVNEQYPPKMKTDLMVGMQQANQLMTGGQPTSATMKGLETWQTIQQHAPLWGQRLVDANTRRFYDAALANMRSSNNDPAVAIRMAVEAASAPGDVMAYRRKQVYDKMVDKAGRNQLGLDLSSRNSHGVLEQVRAIAEAKADYGMPIDSALTEAVAEVKASTMQINGAYVNTNVRGMTPDLKQNLPQLSMSIIREYVGQSGDNTDDYTFEPNPVSNRWEVRKRGQPAPDPMGKFTYTPEALIVRNDAELKTAREAGKDKIVGGIKSREQRQADAALLEYERSVINPY